MSHEPLPTDRPAVVTCGLPYANGALHVGHLRSYVAGDLYARALRRVGQQTAFVSGSDMHGTPVAVNAAEEGVEPRAFALEYHEQYETTFPEFNVEFDQYGHTDDQTNRAMTTDLVGTWIENDHIHEQEIEVAYDPQADTFLPDRYIEGTCPHCGELARGDECDEGCGRHLEPGEVETPRSTLTDNPAEYRSREHKFLRLADFQSYLQSFLDRLEGSDRARSQPREWIEGELKDLCITRDIDWGVEYPGEEPLVLYVWVDAPIEYVSATKQYSERVGADSYDWEQVWLPDGERRTGAWDEDWADQSGEITHIIGKDIIQHHTVFWPAMLRAAGFNEPRAVLATGHVGIAGQALSTSRGRAVWAQEYLDAGFHPAPFRYYILTGAGFEQDVDFSWDRFADRVNSELVGTLGNFWYRALLFAHRNYDGTPAAALSQTVRERIEAAVDRFETAVREYDIRALAEVGVELSRFGNEYIQQHEPWNLISDDPDRAAQVVRDCVQLAKAAAVLTQPVMPEKARALWAQLGEPGDIETVGLSAALAPPPAEFGAPEELFAGVEDETVERLEATLAERVGMTGETETDTDTDTDAAESGEESGEAATDVDALVEDRVSIEAFGELDLRVGRIETAEPIEGADELVRLKVDIGLERRQVVAGLKQLHDVDELPGSRVVLAANIEKAELFGHESNGMVLAAGDQADLLTTHENAPLGARIR